jgi:MFS family permease
LGLHRIATISLVNFLLYCAIETSIVFIPLFGAELGGSDFQIGLVGAFYGIAYLVSSLFCGRLSDRWGKEKFIRIGLLLSMVTFALQLLVKNLYILMFVRAGVGFAMGVATAALVAHAFELNADMGKFSSWGSFGWIAGALCASWLTDINLLFGTSALLCGMAFLLAQSSSTPVSPGLVAPDGPSPGIKKALGHNFPIYFSVFLRHLGATAVWVILPLYLNAHGMSRSVIAMTWSVNFAVQFVVMRFLQRFDPQRVFAIGQILSIFTFVSFALYYHPWFVIFVQAMLGIGWSCLYVGALLLVLRTGEEKGTASGIFYATLNLCSAIGPFLGGIIAHYWNYQGVMVFAALLGIAGLMVAVPGRKFMALELKVEGKCK